MEGKVYELSCIQNIYIYLVREENPFSGMIISRLDPRIAGEMYRTGGESFKSYAFQEEFLLVFI